MRRTYAYTFVGATVIVATGIFYGFWAYSGRDTPPSSLSSDRAHIESFFRHGTPQDALELFITENEKRTAVEQHTQAHLFGEVVYEKEGLEGMTVCDGSFGFGCYHSFLGRAITDHGPDVVKKLDASCVEKYGPGGIGCFHGIGHGLLSYFGYSLAAVERALSSCSTLSWKRPLGGCADGVFMEYNFRIMETNPADRSRAFSIEGKYQPCNKLNLYQEGCYFGLPAWWATVLPNDATLPARLGGYCSEVSKSNMQRACYRGIGYGILPEVQFDVRLGGQFCNSAADGKARVWCREGLAWGFYADPATRDKTESACTEDLSAVDAKLCMAEYLFVTQ